MSGMYGCGFWENWCQLVKEGDAVKVVVTENVSIESRSGNCNSRESQTFGGETELEWYLI